MSSKLRLALLLGVVSYLTGSAVSAEQVPRAHRVQDVASGSVWADASGRVERLTGGAVVTLGQGAQVQRLRDTSVQDAHGGTTLTHVYKLVQGRVDVSVDAQSRGSTAVLVKVPNGLSGAIVNGRAVIEVSPGAITFTARRHGMLIGQGEHSRQLAEGRSLAIDLTRGAFHELNVPPAPKLFLEHGLTLSFPGVPFEGIVRFQPNADVATHQVALLKKRGGTWLPVVSQRTSSNEAVLKATGTGDFAVVARSVNRFGVEGEVSAPVPLRAVGMALPDGAYVTSGGIWVAPTQQVRLLGVEGLEMGYGFDPSTVEAPASLSLGSTNQMLVRLLDPTTSSELYIRLLAQVARARIALGPATASWPRDSVTAAVSLVDGAGKALPSSAGFTAQVSINLHPVDVAWKRQGNVMRAHIARPASIPGPWVIRVQVKNRRGELVGRDFLEVANGG